MTGTYLGDCSLLALTLCISRLCSDIVLLPLAKEICCLKQYIEKMLPYAIQNRGLSLFAFLNPVGTLEDIAYINITANIVFC